MTLRASAKGGGGAAFRRRTSGLSITLLLLALLMAAPALAQTKVATTVGQPLLIEPSARVAAMGNAGVTTYQEPMAAYFNPGALGPMSSSGAQFTHSQWMAGITYNYAVAAVRLGATHALMLTVTSLDSGEMDVRTVDQPEGTGERFGYTSLAFGLGYGRRLTDRFSAGVQVKYAQETIWHSTLQAVALDLGVLYQLPFDAVLGASVANFGTRGSYDGRDLFTRLDLSPERHGDNNNLPAALQTESYPLPLIFRVGLGLPVTLNQFTDVLVVVDAFHPNNNSESVSIGTEWTFMDVLSARAGYQRQWEVDAETGLTLGAGLHYDFGDLGVQFDYAWNDYGMIGDAQRFTLGVAF